ncbi:MAG: VOC family protein [Terracidiphilus sp.]
MEKPAQLWFGAAMLLVCAAALPLLSRTPTTEAALENAPVFESTCLIASDVKRLVDFYEPILQQKAKWSGNDYAEFATGAGTLAIFSAAAQEKYIPGSAEAAKNRSVIVEFKVADADAEYRRLQGLVKNWVKPPTTQPWGTRSIYFRDPDGNLVDFFSPAPPS